MSCCSSHRVLLVLVAVLLGTIAGLITGILTASGGERITVAVLSGGAAFLAVVPLVLLIEKELGLFTTAKRS